MSVLNQSGEEQVECPLCMEPLEVDDLNFYPCTCGYQICRFCWHRIRTDENGLCPACRKAYSENPADFTPLSKEQVAQLKAEKRQRDQQRKAKLSESRKHLASVRVVQKNLVFVVGLPVRLADADVLKRHEYFGKFGKIHKVVINQSTSYAGSQGPSASAYVTYVKSDDALRAIQSVNNITLDGRLIKSSLGTTKYCSHFMKNQACPKGDCMYLHDLGDQEASFTKEQMHQGKHQEYEKKLHDSLLSRTSGVTSVASAPGETAPVVAASGKGKAGGGGAPATKETAAPGTWPTLGNGDTGFGTKDAPPPVATTNTGKSKEKQKGSKSKKNNSHNNNNNNNNSSSKGDKSEKSSSKACNHNCHTEQKHTTDKPDKLEKNTEKVIVASVPTPKSTPTPPPKEEPAEVPAPPKEPSPALEPPVTETPLDSLSKMQLMDDNSSFFSHNCFQKIVAEQDAASSYSTDSSSVTPHSNILNDNLPDISSSEDWEAAFGFSSNREDSPRELRNSMPNNGYVKLDLPFNGYQKPHDTILDLLANRNGHYGTPGAQPHGVSERLHPYVQSKGPEVVPAGTPVNGLDQQMSKFFAEFKSPAGPYNGYTHQNGYVNERQGPVPYPTQQQQQQQRPQHDSKLLDEQTLYNLKQNAFNQSAQYIHASHGYVNGGDHYLQNGQSYSGGAGGNGHQGFSVYQNQQMQHQRAQHQQNFRDRSNVEDDLGFDPFHETQKALAELIESEQTVSQITNTGLLGQQHTTSNGGGPMNGLVHHGTQGPSCMPPPPPGFLQHSTHMNSFGSKILPFLNMASSQQQQGTSGAGAVPTGPAPWSTNSYTEAQLKGLAPVNDWMTLDPAIVSSSRHFPLASLQPLREQYSPFQQSTAPPTAPARTYEYQNNGYATSNTYGLTQQPATTGSAGPYHQGSGAGAPLSWYAGNMQSQIASPPGFRQAPQGKSQEC